VSIVKIYVTVKQAGKRKAYLTKQEIVLHHAPNSLRDLITQIVRINVEAYNQKAEDGQLVQYLLPDEIDDQAETGKITFGERRNEKLADMNKAIDTAILAFQDGLVRAFSDENEITDLDEPLELRDESVLTFIRFTMLAGRMW
jgi:hypothetical protein